MSKPSLLTRLTGWFEFEEDFDMGHTAMNKVVGKKNIGTSGIVAAEGTLLHAGTQFRRKATRTSGMFGYGIEPETVFEAHHDDFSLMSTAATYGYTIATWFKYNPALVTYFGSGYDTDIASKYYVVLPAPLYEFRLFFNAGVVRFDHGHTLGAARDVLVSAVTISDLSSWHFIIAWVDPSTGLQYIQVDDNAVDSQAATIQSYSLTQASFFVGDSSYTGILGKDHNSNWFDNLMLWKRALTDDERLWIWNSGAGRSYAEVDPEPFTEECQAITCCDPEKVIGQYVSESATSSGTSSGITDECSEVATLAFDPPCGSTVVFPILVSITCNYDDAVIYYTLDGTDPTSASTAYTGPIAVVDPVTHVRAIGIPNVCPASGIYDCSWVQYSDATILFDVHCTSAFDFVGQWGDWTPNGTNDTIWWLAVLATVNVDVARFEIYQLDINSQWTTGAAWSSDTPCVPEPPWDQGQIFDMFPLYFDEVGVGAVHADYTDHWGIITVQPLPHQYIVYGDPLIAFGGIYKIIMIETSGRRTYAYAHYDDCNDVDIPDPCPYPVINYITPGCASATVNFTVLAPNRNWRIYRREVGTTTWVLSSIGLGSGVINQAVTLVYGRTYEIYVSQELGEATYDHCEDWTNSQIRTVTALDRTTLAIESSVPGVVAGDTVVITVTSTNVPAGGVVTVTNTNTYAGVPCGAHPWTPAINTTATCTFTLNATTTWNVSVAGGCTSPTATVTVIVEPPVPACDSVWVNANPALQLWHSFLAPGRLFTPCQSSDPLYLCEPGLPGVSPEWDGVLINSPSVLGQCRWHTGSSWTSIYEVTALARQTEYVYTFGVQLFASDAAAYGGPAGTDWWIMLVTCRAASNLSIVRNVWIGNKSYGTTPVGAYSRLTGLSMCDTTRPYVSVRSLTP